MFHGIDAEAVDIGFADPVTVGLNEGVNDRRTDGVVIVGVVLQPGNIAVLVLGVTVVILDIATPVIPVTVAKLGRYWPVGPAKIAERENDVVLIGMAYPARIEPVVARMIDHNIENDPDGEGLTVSLEAVRGLNEIDEVLFRPEMRVDSEVIVGVVAVIGARVVFEDRRQPDRCAAKAGDVVEMPGHAFDGAAVKTVRRGNAGRAASARHGRTNGIVLEAVDKQKIDKLLPPFAIEIEVGLARGRREVDVVD